MDELRKLISRIKLVRMRTPNLVKIALTILIVVSMVVLIGLRIVTEDLRQQTEDLRDQAAALDLANDELDEKIGALDTIQSVIDIAKEELGLVEPGTVIFETGPAPTAESSEGN